MPGIVKLRTLPEHMDKIPIPGFTVPTFAVIARTEARNFGVSPPAQIGDCGKPPGIFTGEALDGVFK